MKPRLLDYLACPKCRGALELRDPVRDGDEVMSGALACACGASYPIRGGVPRFADALLSPEEVKTAANFGYQWKAHAWIEPRYERQFLDWVKPLAKGDFAGKVVLDAGCGKGRHMFFVAQYGARDVIGLDLSGAVDAAFANTRQYPNAHVIQASLLEPPLKGPVDVVYSVGVLHHLPEPVKGFLALSQWLKPGGRLAAWIYGRENNGWVVNVVGPLRRRLFSKLPGALLKVFAHALGIVLWLVVKGLYRPLSAIGVRPYYHDYMMYLAGFPYREIYLIVFDHLTAPTAFYIPRDEFARWFDDARLATIEIAWHNRNSWRGLGQKPA